MIHSILSPNRSQQLSHIALSQDEQQHQQPIQDDFMLMYILSIRTSIHSPSPGTVPPTDSMCSVPLQVLVELPLELLMKVVDEDPRILQQGEQGTHRTAVP